MLRSPFSLPQRGHGFLAALHGRGSNAAYSVGADIDAASFELLG
jgi:hypothetical protein